MKFNGILTPIITPHRSDGSIDRDALVAQIEYLIESGVHGIINGGSTGEYYVQAIQPTAVEHGKEIGRAAWRGRV